MANLTEMKAAQQKGTNAVAERKNHPVLGKTDLLEARKDLLGAGLPGGMNVEREIRTATIMLMGSKELKEASPASFYTAVSIALNSGIGLGRGRGYLVAYKGNCSFVPDWRGLVDLVSRSGRATVWTGVVHKGDIFEYELGDSPFLKHKPGDSDEHADITHYYSVGRVKDSQWPIIEVWSVNKVKKHLAKYNKVGNSHYAKKDDNNFEMYGRKVVLLQVLKYLPQSQDLQNALTADMAHDIGANATIEGNFVYVNDIDDMPPPPDDGPGYTDVQHTDVPRTDAPEPAATPAQQAEPQPDPDRAAANAAAVEAALAGTAPQARTRRTAPGAE